MKGNWIWLILVVLIIGGGVWFFNRNRCKETDSPFECIRKKAKSGVPSGLGGWIYKGYTFYSNYRVFHPASNKRGTYDKKQIKWDDGSITPLSEIFTAF